VKHIAPERWADLEAGKVSEPDAVRLRAHADGCTDCSRARDRVTRARSALARVRDAGPPSLGWDLLGARLYWSTSSEMRRRERERDGRRGWVRRAAPVLAVGLAVASGVAAVVLAAGHRPEHPVPLVAPTVPPVLAAAPTPAPAPVLPVPPLESAVTFIQGEAKIGAEKAVASQSIHVGDVIQTGRGKIGVQFGDRSAVLVEPESAVEFVAFDADNVVLKVAGAVTVELEKRHEGQHFAVLAGDRSVEVRGTIFRVAHHEGDLDVAVTRGKVAVIDGHDELEVPAPMHLSLAASMHLGTMVPAPVLAAASRELAEGMHVPMVPVWPGGDALRESSAMLSVTAPAKTRVVVDGRPVATGSFVLRALAGRHLVEAGAQSRWVDVERGAATPASFVTTDRNVSERPGQVDGQLLAHGVVNQCGDSARKLSPGSGGDMRVEIGINADGSVDFVTVVRPSTEPEVDRCIVDFIRDRFTFPAGTKATVQKIIHY